MFHRIWIGSAAMPREQQAYGDSFLRHHPAWSHRLWTDKDLGDCPARLLAERFTDMSSRSNVHRFWTILTHGGVYVDTDVECLRPFDPLLDGVTAFTALESDDRVCTAVFGAVAGHPWVKWQLDHVPLSSPPPWGPTLMTDACKEFPSVTVYPRGHFYPYLWDEERPIDYKDKGSFAAHHWARSWLAKPPRPARQQLRAMR